MRIIRKISFISIILVGLSTSFNNANNLSNLINTKHGFPLITKVKASARNRAYRDEEIKYYYNSGIKNHNQGNYKAAISDFTMLIDLDILDNTKHFSYYKNNDLADVYQRRSYSKRKLEDFDGAIIDLTRAIEIFPEGYDGYFFRGEIKALAGNNKEALSDINKGFEIMGTSKKDLGFKSIMLDLRGTIKLKLGYPIEAMNDYNQAIITDRNNKHVYLNRALLKYDNNDLAEAIVDLNEAIEIDPYFGPAYYRRGLIRIEMGNNEKGCKDLNKLFEANALDELPSECK